MTCHYLFQFTSHLFIVFEATSCNWQPVYGFVSYKKSISVSYALNLNNEKQCPGAELTIMSLRCFFFNWFSKSTVDGLFKVKRNLHFPDKTTQVVIRDSFQVVQ